MFWYYIAHALGMVISRVTLQTLSFQCIMFHFDDNLSEIIVVDEKTQPQFLRYHTSGTIAEYKCHPMDIVSI